MTRDSKLMLIVIIIGITLLFPALLWLYIFFGLYYLFSRIKLEDARDTTSVLDFEGDIQDYDNEKDTSKVDFKLQWQNLKDNSNTISSFFVDLCKFNSLRKQYYQTIRNHKDLVEVFEKNEIHNTVKIKYENDLLSKKLNELNKIINEKQNVIKQKQSEIQVIEETDVLNLSGFLSPLYNLGDSETYRKKLEEIQSKQKEQIQNDTAITLGANWVLGNNKKAGQKMMKDISKLILRSFNNECNSIITKMKHNNSDSVNDRLNSIFNSINKLANMLQISIKSEFLELKIKEGFIKQQYEIQKQLEKEAAIEERERLKEEAKVAQEIAKQKAINDKEKTHFLNKQKELMEKLNGNSILSDRDKDIINKNLQDINNHIAICNQKNAELDYHINKASAGYVYIISNIGSFGEDVYKIGVTRRLDPQERIDELASASVPFRFDVHCIVFSDDAFKLEKSLHKVFERNRVNLMNNRKEFFKLDLRDLNEVLKTNFNKHFELKYETEAKDFRESERLRNLK